MNKTININLGGIFFHIDETAYQRLKRYLDAIRKSLSDDPQGREEIITDIESRISELLSERIKDARQVVSDSDIEEIIAVMGQPEDYMVDEELFNEGASGSKSYSKNTSYTKKLFRDGDDKFLGGVSSGIGHYIGIDAIWIRLLWLVLAFGYGVGFVVYFILWILLPEAKTTAEKLQMEGEPVNITNIERKIREEFEEASERVKGAATDVKDAVKEGYNNVSDSLKKKDIKRTGTKAKSGIQEVIEVIGNIIGVFFKIIGKFIGVILILTSVAALVGLVLFLFTTGTVDFLGFDYFFDEGFQVMNPTGFPLWLLSLIVLVVVGIPFLMLFFLGTFILSSRSKPLGRTTKFVLLGLWIIALLSGIFIALKTVGEYTHSGSVTDKKEITSVMNDTLSIKMVVNDKIDSEDFRWGTYYKKFLDDDNTVKYYSNNINFYIKKSDSIETIVKVVKKANGRTRLVAKDNAGDILYSYNQLGNDLLLDANFYIENQLFRTQDVDITLYIPIGQHIYLDESTRRYLRYMKTVEDMYNRDKIDHYYIMTDDGLDCLDCPEVIEEKEEVIEEKDGVKLNIDEDGVELKINDDGEQAEVKIDENGVKIK